MALYAYSAPRRARRLACAWAAGAALLMSAAARAEQPLKITPNIAEQTTDAPKRDEKGAREQELARVRADQKRAAEVQAKLTAEIDAIGEDRRKLSQALIETATRLREIETRISETESKVAALDENANTIRKTLQARRAIIAELLAALQRLGHRPPPALLVRPEDALKAVRTAIMLGAVLPEMRLEAEALVADLSELVQVRRQIDEQRAKLNHDVASLSDEQQRMTGLIEQRQKRQVEIEKEMADERARAATLARQAGNLKDLIAKLDQNAAAAAQRAAKSALQKGEPPPDGRNNAAVVRDARLGPAIAFAATKGTLPLPVSGVKVRDFGAPDAAGGSVKGVSINTRLGAQVTAPCDGWVVYAGPFRSYGQLLILNAGGGYHVLLAGMERISVDLGQFVLTGEPIAAMGGGPQASAPAAHSGSPTTLYVEFRKDGTPVDPGPWWAVTESEKVRG